MRCAECEYYECCLRTPLGGCNFNDHQPLTIPAIVELNPRPAGVPVMEAYANTTLLKLARKVKSLRDAQNLHAKTMGYGYRNLALRLGKEVDEMLDKLQIE